MTFSIVARDAGRPAWGVAVASKFLAVGAAVPAAAAGTGAVATQAMANLGYKAEGLRRLTAGEAAPAVVEALTAGDAERSHRQVGVVDRDGGSAAYTGESCIPWAGHRTGLGYAIQGNCLTGPDVLEATESSWSSGIGLLPRRLLAALAAGDDAGGDRRGRQSAALLVVAEGAGYGGSSDVWVDLRVDDHPAPVPELARLLDLHDLYFGKPDPAALLPLGGPLLDEVAGHLRRLGHLTAHRDLTDALAEWVGTENYEERHVDGHIDPVVLSRLREQASG